MKKFILGITTLICCSTMAQEFEANIKVGYDFYRSSTIEKENRNIKYRGGFVIGLELLSLTFNNEKIKIGAGVEYNFGETKVRYEKYEYDYLSKLSTMVPLYATAKFTYYRPKNIDLNLYTFARLGYAFSGERPNDNNYYANTNTSGLYYGLGLGIDYKYFLAEILYDGKYSNEIKSSTIIQPTSINIHTPSGYNMFHYFHHKVGIRLGLQLGSQHFKKAQIEPKIFEKKVNQK